MRIGTHNRQPMTLIPEYDSVGGGRELCPAAKEPVVLGQAFRSCMGDGDTQGHERHADKRPAHAHQRGEEELNLVSVGMAGHAGVVEPYLEVRALAAAKDQCFVPDRAEARDPLDRLDQGLRRGRDVVEQADPAQIELPSKLEPEPVPPHGPSHRLNKGDLSFDAQTLIGIFDLRRGQARRLQKRAKVEAGVLAS